MPWEDRQYSGVGSTRHLLCLVKDFRLVKLGGRGLRTHFTICIKL